MKTRARLLCALALMLLTGCEASFLVDLSVAAGGGGTLVLALEADAELLQRAQAAGADPLDELAAVGADLAEAGWESTDAATAEGGRRVALAVDFAEAEELNALSEELVAALAAPEVELLSELRLVTSDERIVVTGLAGMEPTEHVTELGLQPEQAVELLRDTGAVRYEVAVTLPGRVLESTATSEDDGRLVWSIAPGERMEIRAEGVRPLVVPWVPLLLGAAGGLVVLLVLRRRLG